MPTMTRSQWQPDGTIKLIDVDPGPIQPGWARLKVHACGICGSDLHRLKGHVRPGAAMGGGGNTPGHELVGTIIEASSSLPDVVYAVEPRIACGTCEFCLEGRKTLCRSGTLIGAQIPGGLADFMDIPEKQLYPVDASLTDLEASLAEPLSICVRAVNMADLRRDTRVLVLGAGTLGLLSGLLARDTAERVAVSVRYPHQEAAAKALGLETVGEADVVPFSQQFEPDVVIETVGGTANTMEQATAAARPGGRIVVLGLFSISPELDMGALIRKELHIMGSAFQGMSDHGSEFGAATQLLPRYRTEMKSLQTHQFPLSNIRGAFECAIDRSARAIKITVFPG
jgi:threonine dehydrogenase-like Zn-dependent dehydrogenase